MNNLKQMETVQYILLFIFFALGSMLIIKTSIEHGSKITELKNIIKKYESNPQCKYWFNENTEKKS